MSFTSISEEIENFNIELIEKKIFNILNQIDSFSIKNNPSDIVYSLENETSLKNIYYDLANAFIDLNVIGLNNSLFELFKIKFNDYYINQDKYKKAYYNHNDRKVKFETTSKNAQIVNIKFKKNHDYSIEVKDDLSIVLDSDYDYNLIYLVDNNPLIKSGFIFIDNRDKVTSHSIIIEEVNEWQI